MNLRIPAVIVALGGLALGLSAQEIKALRVGDGPRIDGRLNDPAWQGAAVIDGFRMVEPRPGDAPSERTEAPAASAGSPARR